MMLPVALCVLLLSAATLGAAPLRFARSGETEGTAEIQVHAAEAWRDALRNTPLPQGSRMRTAANGRLEVELDEGSVLRLTGDTLAEVSDYTQLSTGQRISLISLDHGTVYFTGRPHAHDSLSVAVPGAQLTLRKRARLRFEVNESWTQIAVLEGLARFATPSAELEIREGQMARLDVGRAGRFQLLREIPPLESDDWSRKRDVAQEGSLSAPHLPGIRFGAADLDLAGSWLQTDDAGLVWKPKTDEDWVPFQKGNWRWYDEIGYTWTAAENWGWTPYHFGRWLQHSSLGWVWAPGSSAVFKPGEVYWMRTAGLALWGPLAPDEWWTGAAPARQFAALNTIAARFEAGQREIDPGTAFIKPKDMLTVAKFTVALPSPPFISARLEDKNAPLQSAGVGAISFAAPEAAVPGASFEPTPAPASVAPVAAIPPRPRPATVVVVEQPVYVEVSEPVQIYFPVPVYSGVVILNPTLAADSNQTKRDSRPDSRPSATPAPEPPHHPKKRITPPELSNPVSVPIDKASDR